MKRVCVFCGSNSGAIQDFAGAARLLGHLLAGRNIALVYGGSSFGLMGELARAVLDEGGEVIGVTPSFLLEKEKPLGGLADLRVVSSMHERKALMEQLSDGFIALPGGLGTLEEFFEIVTWAQLGMHRKPCGILNVCNYYGKLIEFLDAAVEQLFIKPQNRDLFVVENEPDTLLNRFEKYQPPKVDKLLNQKKT